MPTEERKTKLCVQTENVMLRPNPPLQFLLSFFLIVLFSSGTPTSVFAFCARQRRQTGRRAGTVGTVLFRSSQAFFLFHYCWK